MLHGLESLEARRALTATPYGATSQDTAEFLLGDVSVNVVLLESNGQIDANTEDWNSAAVDGVKQRVEEGLQWWVDTLALHSDVHYLNFHIDYTYTDAPIETSYEPISRDSQDFVFWIEDFFDAVNIDSTAGFSDAIREFNHERRIANQTDWSFTMFVINSENDLDHQFGDDVGTATDFRNAFAFPGGRFIVLPHLRPAQTIAHEVGHMFWAFDEYLNGGDRYTDRRGYYATQNTNAGRGNPDPDSREPSIMRSLSASYDDNLISQSARETIGWRDSDGNGIFDVLDVPHTLSGNATFDEDTGTVRLIGQSSVQTLENQNPSGTGGDMTINRITDLQVQFDDGPWTDLVAFDDHVVDIDASTVIHAGVSSVSFRTIDDRIGVTSNVITVDVGTAPPLLQNPENPVDVNADGFVTAIDALLVINAINRGSELEGGPPYLDVTGDSVLSARDVLLVINYINARIREATVFGAAAEPRGDEPPTNEQQPDPSVTSTQPVDENTQATAVAFATVAPRPGETNEPWLEDNEEPQTGWWWS